MTLLASTTASTAQSPERDALALRLYQRGAVDAVLAARDRGVRRLLGVAATGLGKTIVVGAVARALHERTIVLAHREELIDQAVEKISWCWPDAVVGAVQGPRDDHDADVVVGSVQTLVRPGRFERLGEGFGFVVVDECHHVAARSYQSLLARLGCGRDEGPLLLGVTATPERADAVGLAAVFDEVVFTYDLAWGIRNGYLADLRGRRVRLELDMSEVGVRGGDLDDEDLGRAMERANAPSHIVEAWLSCAADRHTFVFVPTVRVAEETATMFRDRGVNAGVVSDVDRASRKATLVAFAAGELQVLVNCAVLTEGVDMPRVDCIVLARPTRSRALFTQCIGRGMRRHPEKVDCLVLDMTGADEARDLVSLPSLLGVEDATLAKQIERGERLVSEALALVEQSQVVGGRLCYEDLDLFAGLRAQKLAWVVAGAGLYACSVGSESLLIERVGGGERWSVGAYDRAGGVRVLLESGELELAQGIAEDYVRGHGNSVFVSSEAAWRSQPPTARQLAAAQRWRVEVQAGWTAGDVSAAIDAKAALAHRRKARSLERVRS